MVWWISSSNDLKKQSRQLLVPVFGLFKMALLAEQLSHRRGIPHLVGKRSPELLTSIIDYSWVFLFLMMLTQCRAVCVRTFGRQLSKLSGFASSMDPDRLVWVDIEVQLVLILACTRSFS